MCTPLNYELALILLLLTFRFFDLSSAAHGSDEFGKHTFPATRFSLEDPLWMLEVTPVLHHSNGGIKVGSSL